MWALARNYGTSLTLQVERRLIALAVRPLANAGLSSTAHIKLNYLSFDGIADDLQLGHGNGKLESTRARASGIDVEHTATILYRWPVRMARHNHVKSGCHGIEIQFGQIVQDVDKDFTNLKDFCFRDCLRPRAFVIVATYRSEWCKIAQLLENVPAADIPGVDNEIAPTEECRCLRPQQSVSIRDETYS